MYKPYSNHKPKINNRCIHTKEWNPNILITLETVIKSQVRQTKDEERSKKLTTKATTKINKMAIIHTYQ